MESKAKHFGTLVVTARDNRGWIGVAREDGGTIAHLPDFPVGSANKYADLFAAAPELAEALAALVALASDPDVSDDDEMVRGERVRVALARAEAALAKAGVR